VRSPSLSRRVALAGGYTAGHIMPMIAVGEAYAECCPGARIIAVGERYGLEARLLPERGFAFHAIAAASFFGATTPAGLKRAAASLYRGFWRARRILKDTGTETVIGFGGYVAAPTVLAARSLDLVTVLFEPNVVPGRANRLLRLFADCRLVGQGETRETRGWEKALVAGHPIREEIAALEPQQRRASEALHILVTGGSLGSAFLDRACPELCAKIAQGVQGVGVLHQSCAERVPAVSAAYESAGVVAEVRPFLDMRQAYAQADFVICAAGAGTLAVGRR
jgi:UDP-N-acetylglucosamine--N-acetylmuramyl-(pentapeptide) pyrophosphoryl-undecaprenol N-acetylglucosamine transferase